MFFGQQPVQGQHQDPQRQGHGARHAHAIDERLRNHKQAQRPQRGVGNPLAAQKPPDGQEGKSREDDTRQLGADEQIAEGKRNEKDVKKKMMVDKLLSVKDGERQPIESWAQALGAHQVSHLDVIISVIADQVGGRKLGHSQKG